jgi:hypothetical protein
MHIPPNIAEAVKKEEEKAKQAPVPVAEKRTQPTMSTEFPEYDPAQVKRVFDYARQDDTYVFSNLKKIEFTKGGTSLGTFPVDHFVLGTDNKKYAVFEVEGKKRLVPISKLGFDVKKVRLYTLTALTGTTTGPATGAPVPEPMHANTKTEAPKPKVITDTILERAVETTEHAYQRAFKTGDVYDMSDTSNATAQAIKEIFNLPSDTRVDVIESKDGNVVFWSTGYPPLRVSIDELYAKVENAQHELATTVPTQEAPTVEQESIHSETITEDESAVETARNEIHALMQEHLEKETAFENADSAVTQAKARIAELEKKLAEEKIARELAPVRAELATLAKDTTFASLKEKVEADTDVRVLRQVLAEEARHIAELGKEQKKWYKFIFNRSEKKALAEEMLATSVAMIKTERELAKTRKLKEFMYAPPHEQEKIKSTWLQHLEEERRDLAIIQNDIAHETKKGKPDTYTQGLKETEERLLRKIEMMQDVYTQMNSIYLSQEKKLNLREELHAIAPQEFIDDQLARKQK